jgi:predicted pyridoxine 5'-phosphate oxidase superfamily flavin-nucleotide-binding protein
MNDAAITTVADLEGVIGKTPPPMHLKVIDHLDAGALRWISQSPLMFAGFGDASGVGVTLAGGAPGFANGDVHELRVPVASLDDPALARPGTAFGALFLVPGIGETLRVNGRLLGVESDHARIAVEECYGHCAKALIRSELWVARPAQAPDDLAAFVAASRFLALATIGTQGRADLSPKGDPAGCMAQLDGDLLWFADRPGNRRVDSFRNIVEQAQVALTLLVPGASRIATVRGRARLTTDPTARERFTVRDKTPLLAIRVEIDAIALHESAALARAGLWPVHATTDIDPTKLFVEHIKLNKVRGVGAALARASLAVPGVTGLLKKGLDKDYKDNLD